MRLKLSAVWCILALSTTHAFAQGATPKPIHLGGAAPEGVTLSATVIYSAERGTLFCREFLGDETGARTRYRRTVAHIANGTYSLDLDLARGEGGFCRWRAVSIWLDVNDAEAPFTIPISLEPAVSASAPGNLTQADHIGCAAGKPGYVSDCWLSDAAGGKLENVWAAPGLALDHLDLRIETP